MVHTGPGCGSALQTNSQPLASNTCARCLYSNGPKKLFHTSSLPIVHCRPIGVALCATTLAEIRHHARDHTKRICHINCLAVMQRMADSRYRANSRTCLRNSRQLRGEMKVMCLILQIINGLNPLFLPIPNWYDGSINQQPQGAIYEKNHSDC